MAAIRGKHLSDLRDVSLLDLSWWVIYYQRRYRTVNQALGGPVSEVISEKHE